MKELKLTQEESKLLYTELENYTPRRETYKEFMDLIRKLRKHGLAEPDDSFSRSKKSSRARNKRLRDSVSSDTKGNSN